MFSAPKWGGYIRQEKSLNFTFFQCCFLPLYEHYELNYADIGAGNQPGFLSKNMKKMVFFTKKNALFGILGGVKNEIYDLFLKNNFCPYMGLFTHFFKNAKKKDIQTPIFFTKKLNFLLACGQKWKNLRILKKTSFFRFPHLFRGSTLLFHTLYLPCVYFTHYQYPLFAMIMSYLPIVSKTCLW